MDNTTSRDSRGGLIANPVSRRSVLGLLGAAATGLFPSAALTADGPEENLPENHAESRLNVISPALLEAQAKTAMPAGAFEYVHGAAGELRRFGMEEVRVVAEASGVDEYLGFAEAQARQLAAEARGGEANAQVRRDDRRARSIGRQFIGQGLQESFAAGDEDEIITVAS